MHRLYKDRTTSPLSELLDMSAPVADPQFVWQYTECGPSLDEPQGPKVLTDLDLMRINAHAEYTDFIKQCQEQIAGIRPTWFPFEADFIYEADKETGNDAPHT